MTEHRQSQELHDAAAIVIPCYNAGARVAPVVARCLEFARHIIVVDDGSTDDAVATLPRDSIQLVQFPVNRGKGFALLEGFRRALSLEGVECVVVLDADGQHDPAELPGLFEVLCAETADLVIGSRSFDQTHVPWRSRIGNKATIALTRALLGTRIPDTQSGYRLHSRRFAEAVVRDVLGGRYDTEMEILVKAVKERYVVRAAPIKTLYETGNPSSHFNKLRDPILIYGRLIRAALRRAKS